MVGVVPTEKALGIAKAAGLDLVEVSPNAEPPVCKVLDYGKFKFQQQRKGSENRKKQRVQHVKEIKLRPNIEDHDYQVKLRSIEKFIGAGDKVKISLRFRGREIAHNELGMDVMKRILEDTTEIAKVELEPKMESRQIIMIIMPK